MSKGLGVLHKPLEEKFPMHMMHEEHLYSEAAMGLQICEDSLSNF